MPNDDAPNFRLRRLVVGVLAVFILIVAIGVPVAILAPVPEAQASVPQAAPTTTPAAHATFPSFGDGAVGAVGLPGVLATSGSQKPHSIASITKVVTMLVVLEKKPLTGSEQGPTITFTDRDVQIYDQVIANNGSNAPVAAGWKLTERQAIETTMLPSANNYAESLAIWAYGSVPRFLTAAKAFLKAHGLTHTTLVDSNGLDAGDKSTPSDLVALGMLAHANAVLAEIVSMHSVTEPQIGLLTNTNELLGQAGVDGMKTGTTDQAGACLLFTAKVSVDGQPVELVGVILGAPSHPQLDATVPGLLRSVTAGLHEVKLSTKAEPFATYHTKWGGTAKAVAGADAMVLVWGKQHVSRTTQVEDIRGGRKNERVGSVAFAIAGRTVAVPLLLDRNVLAAPVWWRLTHPLR
ncbi:MAG TPA: D-alanyl-D-alanine carboxypeptidase [Amnibacterium sp.]|uniref:D-alanyl-D-alanine carboxypeptidase family protein n=1 Tax=Amnibacterium sp. TaxID=1872496 RepID=UPI002F95EF82